MQFLHARLRRRAPSGIRRRCVRTPALVTATGNRRRWRRRYIVLVDRWLGWSRHRVYALQNPEVGLHKRIDGHHLRVGRRRRGRLLARLLFVLCGARLAPRTQGSEVLTYALQLRQAPPTGDGFTIPDDSPLHRLCRELVREVFEVRGEIRC